MISLAWLILWIPFFAAAGILFFLLNRPRLAGWVATGAISLAFIFSLALLFQSGIPNPAIESSVRWVTLPGVTIEFGILINGLTLLMLLVVTGVGSLIFFYSQEYMEGDSGYSRYFAALSLFAFSMLGIVLANNLAQIFIFWELVGLSSYLLIGHWFERPEASEAAKKAFLTTRVGDVGFLLGILLLFGWLESGGEGTFNFLRIESLIEGIRQAGPEARPALPLLIGAGLLIFLGVAGKSAQFPLHVWLPDAMEGPTPVSALIHAATLVAAGVFLLARLFFIFSVSPLVLSVITGIGSFTAFFAASLALVQNDLKRILAYSTLSQLGLMVAGAGLGNPQAGMFHLTTHAFFKALLFLSAGSVIHALHTQEIEKMGGLLGKMPVTGWTFFIGMLALVGIFPTAGFWSKEEILLTAYHESFPVFLILLLTTLFTAFYMGRSFARVFLGRPQEKKSARDPHWPMKGPLWVLAFFSLIGGLIPWKNFLPLGLEISAGGGPAYGGHASPFVTLLGLGVGIAGLGLSLYLYTFQSPSVARIREIAGVPRKILERKYYMDELYDFLIRYGQDAFARLCDLFERTVVVGLYVNGTARLTARMGDWVRKLQTGRVQFYALLFSLGVTALTYGFLLWNR